LVKTVRDDVLPPVDVNGMTSYVGGYTASYVDLATLITNRLLLVIGTVILLGFLLLMIAFRSILIPLQAAITNLLSAAASFGVLTAVSSGLGHLPGRHRHPGHDGAHRQLCAPDDVRRAVRPVHGLRGVLVSHVQAHHHQGEPAKEAARSGLGSSARITSAAAMIMASVFASSSSTSTRSSSSSVSVWLRRWCSRASSS